MFLQIHTVKLVGLSTEETREKLEIFYKYQIKFLFFTTLKEIIELGILKLK